MQPVSITVLTDIDDSSHPPSSHPYAGGAIWCQGQEHIHRLHVAAAENIVKQRWAESHAHDLLGFNEHD